MCPQAEFKFFITASVEKRAKRRHKQTSKITLEETKELIIARDKNDESRSTGPLKKADDAFEIDNSNLTLEQTVGAMLKIMENKNG
ncbi:(d)CMP kinase [Spiroplasma endosymbiont of Anurida maritima]|uniref:(d)CMP kinase n=1 Tax=Spiroplasma endosymbiont of Anurida maritima TaxID=2967972 RepID=UPI0036D2CCEE